MRNALNVNLLAALCLTTFQLLAADPAPAHAVPNYKAMRAEVEALAKWTQAPKYEVVERGDATPNLKPILYVGPDYQGKPTKVFAWLGLPEKREGKVPAVVLVHGGGGTASKAWVQNWNNHGYAAISMSLEGHTDNHTRLPDGGPSRPGIFGDSTAPIKDQWMYQCVADATLAAALLRSLPEVDPGKIGISGCSWGGIITATVIGIDPRYAFAIPVYGCGGLDAIPNQYGGSLANNEVYKKVWDANLRLDRARMPILWLSWPQDAHFPMDALALSSQKAAHSESSLCLIPGMGHGNLTERPEWFAFADSVIKEGRPWIQVKSSKVRGGKVQATFISTQPLESAVLISTIGTGHTGGRQWIETPAAVKKAGNRWIAEADVPKGTTACFINVKNGQLTATSDYFEIDKAIKAVSPERMRQVYDEVKTPFKYGVVLRGEANQLVDSPSVFRKDGQWYMVYIASVGNLGYETCLARSKDLLHWEKLGKILSFRPDGWDRWQRAGYIALSDPTWGGSNELQPYEGKYWMSYLGGSLQGYETDPLAIGLAWTKTPTEAVEWTPIAENPVLHRDQPDVRPFEKVTLYKSNIIRDKAKTLGSPFVMYYNGKIKGGYEQIGMAVSDDMVHWKRYGADSVVANGVDKKHGITGDPQVVKMGDLWVMFYFGAFWRPGAFDTFACSTDLVHWTQWTGPDLVQSSEPWDKTYAHKPWVVKHDGVVYHFYCAVGDQGRVIGLATSRDLKAQGKP